MPNAIADAVRNRSWSGSARGCRSTVDDQICRVVYVGDIVFLEVPPVTAAETSGSSDSRHGARRRTTVIYNASQVFVGSRDPLGIICDVWIAVASDLITGRSIGISEPFLWKTLI